MASARHRSWPRILLTLLIGATLRVVPAHAVQVDDRGEMQLGLRAYIAGRVGTEKMGSDANPLVWPSAPAGSLRQNRYFLQIKFDQNLKRLSHEGWGPPRLFGWMNLDTFGYSLQYRGEWEGLYDYGPQEFSDSARRLEAFRGEAPLGLGAELEPQYIKNRVDRLDKRARVRNRLFLAYVDFEKGPVFLRVGKQVLSWGETDVFRLLDNINPLDASFGGFLIPLDERRIPLPMARASYNFGSLGPLNDAYVEGFGAFGNEVATIPGIPNGSVWIPGGLGQPQQQVFVNVADPGLSKLRGGARFVFNWHDVTWSLAQYWTYLDTPGVTFKVPGCTTLSDGTFTCLPSFQNPIIGTQNFPRVPITGGSFTFPVPSQYLIVRGEMAYFNGEPFNRQGQGSSANSDDLPGTPGYEALVRANNITGSINPFIYPGFTNFCLFKGQTGCRNTPIQGFVLRKNTFNIALGFDHNRWVRWLNPHQTFFISTQVFYKHVFDSPGDLALPVTYRAIAVDPGSNPLLFTCGPNKKRACNLQPRLFRLADNQILQTLAIFTSYFSGRVTPILSVYYDWQGSLTLQPGVTLVRDPFRVVMDYTAILGSPTGQTGTLRDRDNIRMQVEYTF